VRLRSAGSGQIRDGFVCAPIPFFLCCLCRSPFSHVHHRMFSLSTLTTLVGFLPRCLLYTSSPEQLHVFEEWGLWRIAKDTPSREDFVLLLQAFEASHGQR
jgi:hypothetical protein